ncbi:MAG TPA: MFS transporter [Burkholderiaceae bacterium]|nr:MFS transporter [Burkholderiaceae bacterium]
MLGLSQMVAWGSSFFLPAILAVPMARELGLAPSAVYAAFSLSLVISGVLGPASGRLVDRRGGREVLIGSNLMFAAGLAAMGLAHGPIVLFAAWTLMGLAMAGGLLEAAFSTLVGLHGREARRGMTGITLITGFTGTLCWPLTTLIEAQWGWRGACFAWAAIHLLIALPLNAWLPGRRAPAGAVAGSDKSGSAPSEAAPALARPMLTTVLLSIAFMTTYFLSTAMASHLPRLMQSAGMSLAMAVAVGAIVGPAQVSIRLLDLGPLRSVPPLRAARIASMAHPLGALILLAGGAPLAPVYALMYGLGNGILAVSRGALPLVLFGAQGFGARQGVLTMPGKLSQAGAPLLFGLALDHWGSATLWVSFAVGATGWLALMLLPSPPQPQPPTHSNPPSQQPSAGARPG